MFFNANDLLLNLLYLLMQPGLLAFS
ncbi:hypothetical protein AGR7B_Lc10005 [Agrobacterium deltaense RV3]|nr:hypothetical protein AGR7B_Lc10005 [Agrobacterium deltaense RV3]